MVGAKDVLLALVLSGAVLAGPIRMLMHSQCRRVPHEEELPRWAEGSFRWAGWTLERLGLAESVQAHRRWEWLGGPVMLPLANSVFVGLGFLLLSHWCNGSQQMWCDTAARSFSPGSRVFMEEFFPHSCLIVWRYMEFFLLNAFAKRLAVPRPKPIPPQKFSDATQVPPRLGAALLLPIASLYAFA